MRSRSIVLNFIISNNIRYTKYYNYLITSCTSTNHAQTGLLINTSARHSHFQVNPITAAKSSMIYPLLSPYSRRSSYGSRPDGVVSERLKVIHSSFRNAKVNLCKAFRSGQVNAMVVFQLNVEWSLMKPRVIQLSCQTVLWVDGNVLISSCEAVLIPWAS